MARMQRRHVPVYFLSSHDMYNASLNFLLVALAMVIYQLLKVTSYLDGERLWWLSSCGALDMFPAYCKECFSAAAGKRRISVDNLNWECLCFDPSCHL